MKKLAYSGLVLGLMMCLMGCGSAEENNAEKVAENVAVSVHSTEETREGQQLKIKEKGTKQTVQHAEPGVLILAVPPSILLEEAENISITISKTDHTLTLFNEADIIAVYSVGLAMNPVGAKEKEGDHKNPEGKYYVCNKNSQSQYHLALGLSYPNREDALRGYEDELITETQRDSIINDIESGDKPDWYTPLGGEIMIHGQKGDLGGSTDWTRGCFAVNNEVMDYIWDYIAVGTEVTITK